MRIASSAPRPAYLAAARPWQAWTMSTTGDAMNRIVANLVRLARRPGRLLLTAAAVPVGLFALFGLLLGLDAETWTGWVPLVLAGLLAVPVVVLAVRRERLQRTTADLGDHPVTTAGGVVVVPGDRSARVPGEEELAAWTEAMDEGRVRTARWFPRVEATQRALVRAAGGTVQAPYLKDDLRVTLVAFLGTVAAIPFGVLGTFVSAFALLLR